MNTVSAIGQRYSPCVQTNVHFISEHPPFFKAHTWLNCHSGAKLRSCSSTVEKKKLYVIKWCLPAATEALTCVTLAGNGWVANNIKSVEQINSLFFFQWLCFNESCRPGLRCEQITTLPLIRKWDGFYILQPLIRSYHANAADLYLPMCPST